MAKHPAPFDLPGPASDSTLAQRFTLDPFHILQRPPDASTRELDLAAAELIAALERGAPEAGRYYTPLGPRARDAELVDQAADELSDRERRIVHEVWARLPVRTQPVLPPAAPAPWSGGERALGWRQR